MLSFSVLFVFLLFVISPFVSIRRRERGLGVLPFPLFLLKYAIFFLLLSCVIKEFNITIEPLIGKLSNFNWQRVITIMFGALPIILIDAILLNIIIKRQQRIQLTNPGWSSLQLKFHSKPSLNVAYIIVFCVVSGIFEELVFRALIFHVLLNNNLNLTLITLISSISFGAYHYASGFGQVIYSFFYGLIFCLIYVLSDYDFIAVLISHVAGNMFVLLISVPRIRKEQIKHIYF